MPKVRLGSTEINFLTYSIREPGLSMWLLPDELECLGRTSRVIVIPGGSKMWHEKVRVIMCVRKKHDNFCACQFIGKKLVVSACKPNPLLIPVPPRIPRRSKRS